MTGHRDIVERECCAKAALHDDLVATVERLQAHAENDAKRIGELEYALAAIADDLIPGDLEPMEWAKHTLEKDT